MGNPCWFEELGGIVDQDLGVNAGWRAEQVASVFSSVALERVCCSGGPELF